MFDNIKEDIRRHTRLASGKQRFYIIFEQGLWAVMIYRFGRWCHGLKIPILSFVLKLIAFLLFKIIEIITGISLPVSAQIGKGFYVGHFGGIILHSDVVMGANCSIGPGVLIGARGNGKKGTPVIGDNVYIGVGAKILGNVTIGDNAKVGANAVVLCDVPADRTAVGIPAKLLDTK